MPFTESLMSVYFDRLAWVLLHSVWQAALVVGIAVVLMKIFRQPSSANLRYAIGTSALWTVLLLPVVTWFVAAQPTIELSVTDSVSTSSNVSTTSTSMAPTGPLESEDNSPELVTTEAAASRSASPQSTKFFSKTRDQGDAQPAEFSILPILKRGVVWLWLLGVTAFSLRLLRGLWRNWRIRNNVLQPDGSLRLRIQKISRRLGWQRAPQVAISEKIHQAIVTGYFRSIVLLPVTWTTQLPADVLEAVIAHELAHMRRFDVWVILLQRVTESLLFFHPAVWWLSGRVSFERELCCDELAARATGCPDSYAAALEYVGRFLRNLSPASAGCQLSPGIGGQKMELLHRIKHVLGLSPTVADGRRLRPGIIAAVVPAFWLCLIVALIWMPASAESGEMPEDTPAETIATVTAGELSVEYAMARAKGLTVKAGESLTFVEINAPASLDEDTARILRQIERPVDLTIRADVKFSPDNDLPRLKGVPHLRSLCLDVPIGDKHLKHLNSHENLRSLVLERTDLSLIGMRQLAKFPELDYVGLWESEITDREARELLKLKQLRILQLQNCQVTPAIIDDIVRQKNLTSLGLEGCPLRAADVAKLSRLPNLRSLHITAVAHDEAFTGNAILSACGKLKNLMSLDVEGVTCTVEGISRLNSAVKLHTISLSGTIGPLFYPKIGPAYLTARELRFAALYTTERSYFGGSANWQGTRFTLDTVYSGELVSQAEYRSELESIKTPAAADVPDAVDAEDVPARIAIREWRRGMTDEEFAAANGQHSPTVDVSDEAEHWAEGNPTRLHYAMVHVTAKLKNGPAACRGVTLDDNGLVAIPTEFFRENEDRNESSELKMTVKKLPLSDGYPATIVGTHGPVTLIRSECKTSFPMPVSFATPSTGDTVFTVGGLKWNDHLAIAGVLSGQQSVTVPPTLESFSNEPIQHENLIVTNLPKTAEYLGAPLANDDGELIGLCLPLQNADIHGYAVSVAPLREALDLHVASPPEVPAHPEPVAGNGKQSGDFAWLNTSNTKESVVLVRTRQKRTGDSDVTDAACNGIIIDPAGQILTALASIRDAEGIEVLIGKENYHATLVGTDEATELALLSISPNKPLTGLMVDPNVRANIGDDVATVTRNESQQEIRNRQGVVTAFNEYIDTDSDQSINFLLSQFDFGFATGEAVAPLVNTDGKLVGVVVAVDSQATNVGFALPVQDVATTIAKIQRESAARNDDAYPPRVGSDDSANNHPIAKRRTEWSDTVAAETATVIVRGWKRHTGESDFQEVFANGIIVDPAGLILTFHEIVEGAEIVSVTVGRANHLATVIGRDHLGVALLKIMPETPLPAFDLSEWPNVAAGSPVAAMVKTGTNSDTNRRQGVISSTDRIVKIDEDRSYHHLLQFDFTPDAGSAGAPLLDSNGGLLGVIAPLREGTAGIGFAIPTVQLAKAVDEITQSGSYRSESHRAHPGGAAKQIPPNLPQRSAILRNEHMQIDPAGDAFELKIEQNDAGQFVADIDGAVRLRLVRENATLSASRIRIVLTPATEHSEQPFAIHQIEATDGRLILNPETAMKFRQLTFSESKFEASSVLFNYNELANGRRTAVRTDHAVVLLSEVDASAGRNKTVRLQASGNVTVSKRDRNGVETLISAASIIWSPEQTLFSTPADSRR